MQEKFKVGDRVEWASDGDFDRHKGSNDQNLYDIGTIIYVTTPDILVKWDSCGDLTDPCVVHLRLLEEANPNRHVHADLIIAWANGAEIELYNEYYKDWFSCRSPLWYENNKYRIKPKELVE